MAGRQSILHVEMTGDGFELSFEDGWNHHKDQELKQKAEAQGEEAGAKTSRTREFGRRAGAPPSAYGNYSLNPV
jgi:hypothetical protein